MKRLVEPSFDLRNCLECGKELKGRRGKKYCDVHCKTAYHNRRKSAGEYTINDINRVSRRNRSILKTLSPEGRSIVRKEVLDQLGYDYRFFNGIHKTTTGLYYLVYDYAFSPIFEGGIEKALIVKRQDYMDHLTLTIWKKK